MKGEGKEVDREKEEADLGMKSEGEEEDWEGEEKEVLGGG